MDSKRNTPELRFPEFKDEWTRQILGEIATFSKGRGVSKADISDKGELECIRYGELYTVYGETIKDIRSKTHLKADECVLSESNDVIIPASGETQLDIATASCILGSGIALGGDLNIIRSPLNGVFLAYYLNTKKKQDIASLAQGISVVHLYSSQLKTLTLNIPSDTEQNKIAGFLTSIDNKIRLLEKKKGLLEQYKKGIMQKIFSLEIRFKDDDGKDFPDWEAKLLGEIASFSKGRGISKADIADNGVLECIRYGELYTHYGETIKEVRSKTNSDPKGLVLSKVNDVIIPSSGETSVDIATASCVLKNGVALGGDLNIIKSDVDGVFLSYYLNNRKKSEIAALAQGVSVVHLYAKELKTLAIEMPSKTEQMKIANFISMLDKKVNHVSYQIELTRQYKKGLLQQMFV